MVPEVLGLRTLTRQPVVLSTLVGAVLTGDTVYLGGIVIKMCTGSGIRCPSKMRYCSWSANFQNTSPRCRRNCSYNDLRRHVREKIGYITSSLSDLATGATT